MPLIDLGAMGNKGNISTTARIISLPFRLSLFVLGNGTLCRNCVLGHASEILARHVMGENVAW